MKIKKKSLIKEELAAENLTEDQEVSASGDVVVNTETNGEIEKTTVTMPIDSHGNPATQEAKEYAKNAITDALDKAYTAALKRKRRAARGYNSFGATKNVLIVGLPGSSKTATINGWAKARNINCQPLDVRSDDLNMALNGAPWFNKTQRPDGTMTAKISAAPSDILDSLDDPRGTILFLDELNRQMDRGVRGSLLKLVAEQQVIDKSRPEGVRRFPDLLFAVAAINPVDDPTLDNVAPLDSAERRRYCLVVQFDSTIESTQSFADFEYKENFLAAAKEYADPKHDKKEYWGTVKGLCYCDALLHHILDPKEAFEYDGMDKAKQANREGKQLLNQATLTDIIIDGIAYWEDDDRMTVPKFLNQIKSDFEHANLLDETYKMLKGIINRFHPLSLYEMVKTKEALYNVNLGSSELQDAGVGAGANAVKGNALGGGGIADDVEDSEHIFAAAGSAKTAGAAESQEEVKDRVGNFFKGLF